MLLGRGEHVPKNVENLHSQLILEFPAPETTGTQIRAKIRRIDYTIFTTPS